MSDNINIQEIVKRHPNGLALYQLIQASASELFKEIVEIVIDKCAEKADAGYSSNGIPKVNSATILQVKQMIDYE